MCRSGLLEGGGIRSSAAPRALPRELRGVEGGRGGGGVSRCVGGGGVLER